MKEINRYTITAQQEVQSLCWRGDELVDFSNGIVAYRFDGTHSERCWGSFGKQFNRCIFSPQGDYAIAYDLLGTKGLVFKGDSLIREINRSYYRADTHGYPVTFLNSITGRALLVHCPDEFNRLEIEDVETGERLTSRTNKPIDFFHSRLQTTTDGKFLLSAGWIWQPINRVMLFDVESALKNPQVLDAQATENEPWAEIPKSDFDLWEIDGAAFNGLNEFVWIGSDGENNPKQIICVYDLVRKQLISVTRLEEAAGVLMPVGDFAVDFYKHPKLIDLKTGKVVHRWENISSGLECGPIIHHIPLPPPLALDPANKRFAVANGELITVIQLG